MQDKAFARCKAMQMLGARQGRWAIQGRTNARGKAGLMLESRLGEFTRESRFAIQGKADALGKAR
jgi:hypothetical protein